jgi:hypothetical protein
MKRGWWLAGGAAALLLLASRSKAALAPSGTYWSSEKDLDALASMLITETGFARDKNEMAQIVFVALNRSRNHGKPVRDIVAPSQRAPVWNSGSVYKSRFEAAENDPRWSDARKFAQDVLAGAYRNLGATAFVHPSGMPVPPCSSSRVATNTIAGTRCLPGWAVGGRVIGGAMFA